MIKKSLVQSTQQKFQPLITTSRERARRRGEVGGR